MALPLSWDCCGYSRNSHYCSQCGAKCPLDNNGVEGLIAYLENKASQEHSKLTDLERKLSIAETTPDKRTLMAKISASKQNHELFTSWISIVNKKGKH